VTYDLDVCYARDKDNLEALARALAPLHPQLRTVSGPVPFLWDARTLKAGANFTLVTDAGSVDLLGDVAGVDSFSSLWERAAEIELFGIHVRVASIDDLIAMKRAAGRLKDQAHILELEALKRLIEPGSDAEGTEERQG
jgi:hypothetical protein